MKEVYHVTAWCADGSIDGANFDSLCVFEDVNMAKNFAETVLNGLKIYESCANKNIIKFDTTKPWERFIYDLSFYADGNWVDENSFNPMKDSEKSASFYYKANDLQIWIEKCVLYESNDIDIY